MEIEVERGPNVRVDNIIVRHEYHLCVALRLPSIKLDQQRVTKCLVVKVSIEGDGVRANFALAIINSSVAVPTYAIQLLWKLWANEMELKLLNLEK